MEKEKEEVKEMKSYEIKSNQISYLLTMKQFSNENIYFQLRKGISFSSTMYSKEFSFEELKKYLSLSEDDYENISKLFKFFDTEFSKNTISLIKDEHSMILSLKTKTDDKKEVECRLALEETKLSNEEILSMLYTDMMELKYNNIKLNKKNENFEKDINKLLEENKKMKKEKVELQKEITSLSEENQKLKTTLDILHERFKDFKYNRKKPAKPENLRLIDYLTNKNVNSGLFVVFTGLTDNMEYLVYNNKNN